MANLAERFKRAREWIAERKVCVAAVVALGSFAFLLAGRGNGAVSGASTGEWNRIFPDAVQGYRGEQLGWSRPIRSDEWATSTPFVFAQCASKEFFPRINENVNGGADMFLQTPCAPVWDWTAVGQFHNWGYFLFGADRGLAWSWWTRYLLLPLFAFLFFLRWCKGDGLIAATGAAAVTLGAPTQWWDTTVPLHLVYYFASLVFAGRVFASRRWWQAVLAATGLLVSLASYFFVMYPPFTILLLPTLLALGVWSVRDGMTANGDDPVDAYRGVPGKHRFVFRLALLFAATAATAALFAYFWRVHGEALGVIAASSYPGKRFLLGGSLNFLCERSVLDLVSMWTWDELPVARLNECQAAEYIGLWLPVAALFAGAFAKKRREWFAFGVFANATVLCAWCACKWPAWLAKVACLSSIPPQRATVVAGFLVLVAAFRLACRREDEQTLLPKWAVVLAIAVLVAARVFAFVRVPDLWNGIYASGRSMLRFEISAALALAVAYALLRQNRKIFAASLAVFSIAGAFAVHPLVEGISPLRDKYMARLVAKYDREEPGLWMSNDRCVAQMILATGLKCHAATQQYCDRDFWAVVDAKGEFRDVWNRYGHRFLVDLEGKTRPANRGRPDTIFYSLDEDKVRRLGVKYIVWRGKEQTLPWLEHLKTVRNDHIYKVIEKTAIRMKEK